MTPKRVFLDVTLGREPIGRYVLLATVVSILTPNSIILELFTDSAPRTVEKYAKAQRFTLLFTLQFPGAMHGRKRPFGRRKAAVLQEQHLP